MNLSVIIPALNEEDTIGEVVAALRRQHDGEIIVVDPDSTDATSARASAAGAMVYNWRSVGPNVPVRPGKGEALWRGVAAATGDIVVFVDGDLRCVPSTLIEGLAAPFTDPQVALVRASYRRYLGEERGGGGRVTELTAKPLLRLFFPELADIDQPLGGEYALRRDVACHLPFVAGYGVEAGLLIDVCQRFGRAAIAEVDLGERHHRNRPLEQLSSMADVVAGTILERAGHISAITQRPPLATYDRRP